MLSIYYLISFLDVDDQLGVNTHGPIYTSNFQDFAFHLQYKCGLNLQMKMLSKSCKHWVIGEYCPSYFWDTGRTRKELETLLKNTKNGKTSSLINAMLNYRQDDLKRVFLNNGTIYSKDFSVADLIRAVLPNSRIVVILRNPTDR